ncbi:hypothetical protein F4824DRAFT_454008 [Ustulina deusta]|nr:hypothetical protein F4824DRAFT_454008 [Ustulina deusta]
MSLRRATGPKEPQNTMYPQQAHSNQAHRSHASAPPRAVYRPSQPSVPFGLSMLKPLHDRRSSPYIEKEHWPNLRISCQALDIDSSAAHGGEYFQLVPAQYMPAYAQQHNFHNVEDLGPYRASSKFATASFWNDRLVSCLMAPCNDTRLSDRLGWHGRLPDDFEKPKLWYYPKGDASFMTEFLLEPKDGSLPHFNCALTENHLHKEDSLLFSEVWCIVMLTLLALRLPKNEKHNIVPITIVSFCDWQYRIVQGYVDGKNRVIKVWKSRIVRFNQEGKIRKDLSDILRWLLAKPIGDTTKAH